MCNEIRVGILFGRKKERKKDILSSSKVKIGPGERERETCHDMYSRNENVIPSLQICV